jgi:uncharacterized SAM-binding protein YcdF (DUF218 family)
MNPGRPQQEAKQEKRKKNGIVRMFLLCATALLIASAATYGGLQVVGHWLVHEDTIHNANAIAVLSGNTPARALEAAELYRKGYAKEIWLTHPETMQAADGSIMQAPSEDEENRKVLREQGVPGKAIHVFETPITNTADELEVIGSALKSRGEDSVIIVTNKSHTRRVYTLWAKFHTTDGRMMVHAVSDDGFAPSAWWQDSGNSQQVMHEVLGLANVWAGMPVQTSARAHKSMVANHLQATSKLQ